MTDRPLDPRNGSEAGAVTTRLALRPKDAAKALGIGERLLWSKTNAGEIPHVRIGRAVIYPVELLRDWLTKQAKATAKKLGRVDIDMGDTACKVPLALDYITKIESAGRAGKKRKTIRC